MKHIDDELAERLRAMCDERGIRVDAALAVRLLQYLDAVIDMNSNLNLTRIVDAGDALRMHVVDSLMCLPEVDQAPVGELCDIGTGAGFPGVPVCLATGRSGTLLDSVTKKASAVNCILRELGFDSGILAVPERSEAHSLVYPGRYAVATARAVSSLPALVEMASPLLAPCGLLVALKGAPDESELARGRAAARLVGMSEVATRELILPEGSERRLIVTYAKTGRSKIRLQRRPGQAHNTPLA